MYFPNSVLTVLQGIGFFSAGVLFFQGKGSHGVFLLIAGIIPLLRSVFSSTFRRQAKNNVQLLWQSLCNFYRTRGKLPGKAIFIFVILPSLILSLANGVGISSLDNFAATLTAASLVTEGNAELSEYMIGEPNIPYYVRPGHGGIYSTYPLGMVAFAVPIFAVARLVGANLKDGLVLWRLSKWTGAWVAAISVGLFALIALHFYPPTTTIALTMLLSSGSAMLSTIGQGIWSQGGVIFGFLLVLLLELRPKRGQRYLLAQAVGFSIMFSSRLSSVALIIPLGLWLLFRNPRRTVGITLISFLLLSPLLYFNWQVFGTVFGSQMLMGKETGMSHAFFLPLAAILFSPGRGFFVYQVWAILFIGIFLPVQNRLPKALAAMLLSAFVLHLALNASWHYWWGGYCWGSRLLSEMVPIAALLAGGAVESLLRKKNGRGIFAALVVVSFLFHFPYVFGKAGSWNSGEDFERRCWSWTKAPFLPPFQH